MRLHEIIREDSDAPSVSGNVATVSFPMTPGTTKAQQRAAVDPMGHTVNKKSKKKKVASGYMFPVKPITR